MQLTVRFDPSTARAVRDLAERERLSLNQAAVRLVREAVGLASTAAPQVVGTSLDDLFGTWTPEEARELGDAIAFFERIDPEQWR